MPPNDKSKQQREDLRRKTRLSPAQRRLGHENLVFVYALLAGLPSIAAVLILLFSTGTEAHIIVTVLGLVVPLWLSFAWAARVRVIHSLHILANVLGAVRENDFSIRARGSGHRDALYEVTRELNQLTHELQRARFGEVEASALLATVIREIDVAIFAFDGEARLQFANASGQRLLGRENDGIEGLPAAELGLDECLTGSSDRVLTRKFTGGEGRWGLRRRSFREHGKPHQLLVISDLSRTLREEERLVWQRLVRVLGHELNNSLAPIKSLAGSLRSVLESQTRSPDWESDMSAGLEIVESRAEGLSRFMEGYARLARLPAPVLREEKLDVILRNVAAVETRLAVQLVEGPRDLVWPVDRAQLEQALINLLRNASDAALAKRAEGLPHAGVRLSWTVSENQVQITIEDDGHGILNTGNLFVPFFTTKPTGSGIGLILARQIAENHGGNLSLQNRSDGQGAVAIVSLGREAGE
jgi:nitrogen fixation/metabolism regulation signal transduction histidine kinase